MDALNPIKESGPASLKISSKNPVAAEVEKRRTKIKGISLAGKEISFSRGRNRFSKKWSIPDARRADTALIRPISAGAVFNTVRNPRSVPSVKRSKTGSFFNMPDKMIRKITNGMIKSEIIKSSFMEPTWIFYNICKKEGKNSIKYCAFYVKCDMIIRIGEFF